MTKKKRWIVIFLAPGLLLFVFVFLISIVQLGITSFTDWTIGTSPTFAGLKNYIYLFTEDEDFRKVIVNTIIWIVLQSTIHVCIGTTLALILRRKKWYTNLMRGVFMIPNIISSAALGMLFLCIMNPQFGIFDKRFISQSYACRKGKGMHAASDTLKEWLYEWNKYHPDQPLYAIKADIHHYFQSIDHAVLKTEIRKVIKDAGVLALLDRIIDHNGNMPDGVGIPVGNLTSQLFANIYLDALDQFIKHELGVEAYIRYMDDFVILSPDKEQLRNWLARIEQFLREELKLEFNPKTTMLAAKNGIDFVGYKHRATHRKVRKDSIKRIKRTIKKCESGKITKEQLQKSIQSWTGHAGHADSYNLRKKIETLAEAAIEKAA